MTDLVTLLAVAGLILIGLTLAGTVGFLVRRLDEATARAERAEAALGRRPSSVRVTRSPLVNHRLDETVEVRR